MIDNISIINAVHDVSLEVRNFTKNRNGSYSYSCDVCGDSRINPRKARFGIAKKDNVWVCHCFNCGYSNTFIGYIKDFHPSIYERYNAEKFLENAPTLYDLNPIFEKVNERILINIFYVNKFKNPTIWMNYLNKKKISLDKGNLKKICKIHKNYWSQK